MHYYDEPYDRDVPQLDFFRETSVAKTRTTHTCYLCHKAIPQGSSCLYVAYKDDMDDKPMFSHVHLQCWRGY